ncbi:hypothetical protein L2Y96_05060 [Luteibacter aegosomaticola]|uniref:hypothetical protein n=1 Tax=Luteibacter aegosomaticola TaxID=2911538 RepID=UPI001FFA518C|nr:hypothetical protein [Luteibacter aegosomaticola]UPG91149.1 hypothetical protein L2Y96_05060 [Luteibacter aegosomaticola]
MPYLSATLLEMSKPANSIPERHLSHAAAACSFASPLLALAYVTALFPYPWRDSFYPLLLFFCFAWFVSAFVTLVVGLPFALWLRRRNALRWAPVCGYGAVAGMLALSWTGTAYGAIFGLANAAIFLAVCSGYRTAESPSESRASMPASDM